MLDTYVIYFLVGFFVMVIFTFSIMKIVKVAKDYYLPKYK